EALGSIHMDNVLCVTTIRLAGMMRKVRLNGQVEPQPDFGGYLVVRKAELLKIRLVSPVLIGQPRLQAIGKPIKQTRSYKYVMVGAVFAPTCEGIAHDVISPRQ